MEELGLELFPDLRATSLAALFISLSAVNWWFDMVQRTAMNIWRASSDVAPKEYVEYLIPFFIRGALPITLAKWTAAAAYAVLYKWEVAVAAIVVVWLFSVLSPLPARWTVPRIEKKINYVEKADSMLARDLRSLINIWKREGSKF